MDKGEQYYLAKANKEREERVDANLARIEQFMGFTNDRLARIETRLDNYPTKEDLQREIGGVYKAIGGVKEDLQREIGGLHKEIASQTWKIMIFVTTFVTTFCSALVGVTYYIAKNVH